jgi:hypothetical protein
MRFPDPSVWSIALCLVVSILLCTQTSLAIPVFKGFSTPLGIGNALEPISSDTPADATPTPTTNAVGTSRTAADDRLIASIGDASISLSLLAVQCVYAIQLGNEEAARTYASALYDLSTETLSDVVGLDVSEEYQSVKEDYVASLSLFAGAASVILQSGGPDSTETDVAVELLAEGSDRLQSAIEDLGGAVEPSSEKVESPGLMALPGRNTSPFKENLSLFERYLYEDEEGANMISIMVTSIKHATMFEFLNATEEPVTADPGRIFLLVAVKVTNVGHRGESSIYNITTPASVVFSLHYLDTEYSPLDIESFTNLGEPYTSETLARYESQEGYLFFDVPASLNVSYAYLKADLGDQGEPAWYLGSSPE